MRFDLFYAIYIKDMVIDVWLFCVACGEGVFIDVHIAIATLRTPDGISPRQYPSKKYRLAITTLRTPDARSAQSNIVIVRFQSYAPTLRCRCVVTPRLVANKDFVTAPSLRPRRGFAALAKCFRLGTASAPSLKGRCSIWMSLCGNSEPHFQM